MRTLRQLSYSPGTGDQMPESPGADASASLHELQAGMSLAQVVAILRFYWKSTLLIAAAVAAVSAATIKFLPKTYIATATLIVDQGKKDPLAVANVPDINLANYVATQMEIIESPIILLQVVDRMKLTQDRYFAAGYSGSNPDGLREYAEKNLAEALNVELGRGGELLYVSASARYPDRAAEIANTVADTYIEEEHRRLSGPAGDRARRYAEDLAELRAKVAAAQDKLTAFRQQKGITDVSTAGDTTDTDTQALTSLEGHLLDAQNQRRALEAKSAGEQSVADEVLASPVVLKLKTELAEQQTLLAQLSSTYGPNHPKVIEVKSQLALTTRQLDDELRTLAQNTATQLQRARELESKYAQAVADQRAKVVKLREQQGQGAKLTLELESAQSVYKRALDGYDQIMFASAGNNSNVSLVSRATPPVKAAKPNKVKLLLLGIVAGLALGVALPFVYELLFNRRLRCRDDIERSFGVPVLAQLDAIVPAPGTV